MKHVLSFSLIASLLTGCVPHPSAELLTENHEVTWSVTEASIKEFDARHKAYLKSNFRYEYQIVLTPPREPDLITSWEKLPLRHSPWHTVQTYLENKGKTLSQQELLDAVKKVSVENNLSVPEWNIKGVHDHKQLQDDMVLSIESISEYLS